MPECIYVCTLPRREWYSENEPYKYMATHTSMYPCTCKLQKFKYLVVVP
jgi:hypothetical protein